MCLSDVAPVKISLIVATARNRVMGRDNRLPWRLPGDMKYFKQITMGKPLVMGRKTWQSIHRPLPGRTNIIVTRQKNWQPDLSEMVDVKVVHSLKQGLALAKKTARAKGRDEVIVMGGAQIYQQALACADRLYITEVAAEVDGNVFFPPLDAAQWQEVSRRQGEAGGDFPYQYAVYQRKP